MSAHQQHPLAPIQSGNRLGFGYEHSERGHDNGIDIGTKTIQARADELTVKYKALLLQTGKVRIGNLTHTFYDVLDGNLDHILMLQRQLHIKPDIKKAAQSLLVAQDTVINEWAAAVAREVVGL